MNAERDKILGKIQKCLRLSKSANEHEAAAALRQAQKLMAMHGLSEGDLAGVEYGCDVAKTTIPARSKLPIFMSALVQLVCDAFGVDVVIGYHQGDKAKRQQYAMHYWGPKSRVALAVYAHVVVFRAVNNAWAAALREDPTLATQRSARMNFRLAWLCEVRSVVEALGMTDEEKKAVAIVLDAHYGKALKPVGVNTSGRYNSRADELGRAAADGFSLHHPIHGAQQKRLK